MNIEKGKSYTNNRSDLEVYVVRVLEQSNVHAKILTNLYTKNSGRCMEYFATYNIPKSQIKDWYEVTNPQD